MHAYAYHAIMLASCRDTHCAARVHDGSTTLSMSVAVQRGLESVAQPRSTGAVYARIKLAFRDGSRRPRVIIRLVVAS